MCSGLQMAASYGAVTGISNVLPVRYDRNAVTAALMAAVPEVTAVLLYCHQGLQPGCDFQVHTATQFSGAEVMPQCLLQNGCAWSDTLASVRRTYLVQVLPGMPVDSVCSCLQGSCMSILMQLLMAVKPE